MASDRAGRWRPTSPALSCSTLPADQRRRFVKERVDGNVDIEKASAVLHTMLVPRTPEYDKPSLAAHLIFAASTRRCLWPQVG